MYSPDMYQWRKLPQHEQIGSEAKSFASTTAQFDPMTASYRKTVEMSENIEKVIESQKEYAHMCRATAGCGDVATPYIWNLWNQWKKAWEKLTDEEKDKCKKMTEAPIPPVDHIIQIDTGVNDIGPFHLVPRTRADFLTDVEKGTIVEDESGDRPLPPIKGSESE